MFYDNLQNACKIKGISVTAALKRIGIGTANGTYWKNGSSPSADNVVQLSELLEVSTDYLLLGKEKSSSSDLTENEQTIVELFKELSETQQGELIGRAKVMAEQNAAEYEKEDIG